MVRSTVIVSDFDQPRLARVAELLSEREDANGWTYDAQLAASDGSLKRIVLTLSWADYQHWSADGALAPSRVADAVLRVIAQHFETFQATESIDASTVRRRITDGDAQVRAALA